MNPEGLTKRLRRPIRQMFWGMGALLRRARGTRWERRVTQALNQLRAGYDNASFDMTRNGELWLLRRLAQLHPSVLLDIGANRGDWSLAAAASCSSATVHAFEPVPATYERLADAARVNGNIRTYPLALGDQAGELRLWVPAAAASDAVATAYPVAATGMHQHVEGRWIDVPVRRGADLLAELDLEAVDLLKIDAEGFDLNVLRGFGQALGRVRVIQFEYAAFAVKPGLFLYHYYEFLNQHGFEVGRLFPDRVHVQSYAFGQESIQGGIFVAFRPEDDHIKRLLGAALKRDPVG